MAHDDPFTIDLFGNTALSSGLGLGVTAFAGVAADNDPDDDPDPTPGAPAQPAFVPARWVARQREQGANFVLDSERGLASGWKARARDNIAAIRLAAAIEAEQRPATADEQARLIRFTGFGASDLANGVFRRPGETEFRSGWKEIGRNFKTPSTMRDMPRSLAARSTPTSHRSSSSGRSGLACSASAGAGAGSSNPASARGCFRG